MIPVNLLTFMKVMMKPYPPDYSRIRPTVGTHTGCLSQGAKCTTLLAQSFVPCRLWISDQGFWLSQLHTISSTRFPNCMEIKHDTVNSLDGLGFLSLPFYIPWATTCTQLSHTFGAPAFECTGNFDSCGNTALVTGSLFVPVLSLPESNELSRPPRQLSLKPEPTAILLSLHAFQRQQAAPAARTQGSSYLNNLD